MKFLKELMATLTATVLISIAACGGGGGSSGTTSSTGSSAATPISTTAAVDPLTTGVGGSTTQTDGAVSISIGFNDKIGVSTDGLQYLRDYSIKVVDTSGFPVVGIAINPTVVPFRYAKGELANPVPTTPSAKSPLYIVTAICNYEDTNGDGLLNPGEDTNGDGVLTPAKSLVSVQGISGLTTNKDGVAVIQLQYSKRDAGWVSVRLSVTASKIPGAESKTSEVFGLNFLAGEEANAGAAFRNSRFGQSSSCSDTF